MPDIAMCAHNGCPKQKKCYRYMAKPDEQQSYFDPNPPIPEKGAFYCEFFWEINFTKKRNAK